ncbi:MAG: GNAT family N-acetyltransferase [Saprospiraceae bacterium]
MTVINDDIQVLEADTTHAIYSQMICDEMESSAKVRGTGIAKRSPEYITKKMEEGKAVIALTKDGTWVGFCYIETWQGEYVANSGLIVAPDFRKTGVAKAIKQKIFNLSRRKYPEAKIFGLTTGLAVMKINSDLGYEPVTYSELTQDEAFWAGCKSCVNFDILTAKERKNCICTAMLYDPKDHAPIEQIKDEFKEKAPIFERFMKIKKFKFLNSIFERKNKSDNKLKVLIQSIFAFM